MVYGMVAWKDVDLDIYKWIGNFGTCFIIIFWRAVQNIGWKVVKKNILLDFDVHFNLIIWSNWGWALEDRLEFSVSKGWASHRLIVLFMDFLGLHSRIHYSRLFNFRLIMRLSGTAPEVRHVCISNASSSNKSVTSDKYLWEYIFKIQS